MPVVKVLLAAGANPNVSVVTPHAGEVSTPMYAIMSRNRGMVQGLLKAGAEVNPRMEDGGTPLMMAANMGTVEILSAVLAAGADVNARRSNGYTALMVAAERFDPEITRTLIAAGANVNGKTTLARRPYR